MQGLEVVVLVGLTLLVGGLVAQRLRVAAPLVLLLMGAAAAFLPGLPRVDLPPDVVLLLFLPALLYWEGLTTSLREIRANLRAIVLLAVGLVLLTAVLVAVVAHALGLAWPVALVLGAVVAPTDATAVTAVAGRLPRRTLTTLRAESLVNDGTALTLYVLAVDAAAQGRSVGVLDVALRLRLSYAGGAVVGLAVGALVVAVRRRLREPRLENVLSVLTPFLAYLPAELLHVSGVVAVVAGALLLSQTGPRVVRAHTRTQAVAFWELTTYLLNGGLFVLVGLQLRSVVGDSCAGWGRVSASRWPGRASAAPSRWPRRSPSPATWRAATSCCSPPSASSSSAVLEQEQDAEDRLRLVVLADKREAVVALRDARRIDDTVLRRLQARLDLEEVRLSQPVE